MVPPIKQLTLGHIRYLNCVPFFGALAQQGFQGKLVSGVPSELNRMLQQGQLDASPSSSFEYARNWQDYLLLPGHSISSTGKVASVLLFSPVPPEQLDGKVIAITGESATSVNLLDVLLRDCYQVQDVVIRVPDESVENLALQQKPALLIGDRALKLAATPPPGMAIYDLGELWYQHTGLPFVFALWMIRKEALTLYPQELELLDRQLHASRDHVLKNTDSYAATAARTLGLPVKQVMDYWQIIDYRLEEQHLAGLKLFFQRCCCHQLLAAEPPMHFFTPATRAPDTIKARFAVDSQAGITKI